jgi:YVTN family beta-propeller protein
MDLLNRARKFFHAKDAKRGRKGRKGKYLGFLAGSLCRTLTPLAVPIQTIKRLAIILFILSLTSCEKDPTAPPINGTTKISGRGLVVLNEGLFNMNNATLTWYDFESETAHTDWFEIENNRKLGDTGNDMGVYGGKIYVVVNVSSQVEVLDANTGKSLKQIPFFDTEKPRQPRNIAFLKNKAFVCSFDGTVAVVDTTSLTIEKYIRVGRNPDGITTENNKIYVSNSGGLDFPNYDNTVSVIDFDSLEEIKKITVGSNPWTLKGDGNGFVYLIARGNYDDEKMHLQIIDTGKDELVHTFSQFQALSFSLGKESAYVYYYDFMGGSGSSVMSIDMQTREIISENFISDGTMLESIYGIYADTLSGNVFITDAKGFTSRGQVYCFNEDGELLYSFQAGLNPSSMGMVYTTVEPEN